MSTNSPDGTSARDVDSRTVRVAALGCKVSGVEAAAMAASLAPFGILPARSGEPADLVVVQTCTVTERADRDARRLVRRLRRENPRATVVVTGCLARRDPAAAAAIPGVDLVAGHAGAAALAGTLDSATPLLPALASPPVLPQLQRDEDHTRAFLKVQDGCDRRCAFCIVPSVRGSERSAAPEDVEDEIRSLGERGIGEVVLTGIHLAAFARGDGGLLALLRRLEERSPRCRVRISSLEPMEAGLALVTHVASSRVVAPHLHLPLQSGSDSVLRRMRRGITSARFRALAERALARNARLHLATDLIAGFPGETDAEFGETLALVEQIPFGSLHVFPFSPRSGTRAAGMPGQVPRPVVAERAARLREAGAERARAFARRAAGTTAEVLALRGGRGLTDNYLEVRLAAPAPAAGRRFPALLGQAGDGAGLIAREVDKVRTPE